MTTSFTRHASWGVLLAARAGQGVVVSARDVSRRGAQRGSLWMTRRLWSVQKAAIRMVRYPALPVSAAARVLRHHGPGLIWIGVASLFSVCGALGSLSRLEAAGGVAACAFALWLHVAYTQQLSALRTRILALEARIARAGRPEYLELIDVGLLDQDALLHAHSRCAAFAEEVEHELALRRAYTLDMPTAAHDVAAK